MSMVRRTGGGVLFLIMGSIRSIAGNLGLAALSLALALSLWLFVTDKENPIQAQTFNSSISVDLVNVPEGLAVSNVAQTGVRIRIEAPRNELDKLRSDDFRATADLGGLTAGTQNISIDVTPPNSRINVTDISPSRVDVTLEPLQRKNVPVRISALGSPVTGFGIAENGELAEPSEVIVAGPQSLVGLVQSVVAVVNLSGQRIDVVEDRVKLEPRDAQDVGISRVTVTPETAKVTVDLVQHDYKFPFVVKPTITGQPAAGYNVASNPHVDPLFVTVTGTLEILQSIESLGTAEISIADARDDIVRNVPINLPQGATVEGSSNVTVTIDIAPATGEAVFHVAPQVRNLGPGLNVVPAGTVTVTIAGDVPVLNGLNPESIVVTVDAAGLGEGLYSLPVAIAPPAFTSIVRVEPAELGVAITLQ